MPETTEAAGVRLHVNIDHVATLRNARGTRYPDPVRAAATCLDAGADGITAHLREDRRHIKDDDVGRLGVLLRERGRVFNLEMGATEEMLAIALQTAPDVVTLVPERREERTTEGGLAVVANQAALAALITALHAAKIKVSLFIAADPAEIRASRDLGVEQIELHTGDYAHAEAEEAKLARELARLGEGARLAHELGLEVAAGHGLTLDNVPALVRHREIVELNIGHALIADAVFLSLEGAVKAMRRAIDQGRA